MMILLLLMVVLGEEISFLANLAVEFGMEGCLDDRGDSIILSSFSRECSFPLIGGINSGGTGFPGIDTMFYPPECYVAPDPQVFVSLRL